MAATDLFEFLPFLHFLIISLLGSGARSEQAALMTRAEIMAQITEAGRAKLIELHRRGYIGDELMHAVL
ncbi:MAG: hypothetical protein ABF665_03515 [Gluconacetobacter sp.]